MEKRLVMFQKPRGTLVFPGRHITRSGNGIMNEKGNGPSSTASLVLKIQRSGVPSGTEKLIVYLRKNYYLGQLGISWYLKRYHDITVSASGVYSVLKRNGLNRLPQHQRKRSIEPFKRYEKGVTGHRIQIDVKFLHFTDRLTKNEVKRYQYTAIDDATRARVLYIYDEYTQNNAIDFVDRVPV